MNIAPLLDAVPTLLRGEDSTCTAYLKDQIELHEKLTQASLAKERHELFQRPHATPEDYKERRFHFTYNQQRYEGWAGIRFRNLDPNTPFVACTLLQDPAFLLKDIRARQALAHRLQQESEVFSPHGFTLRSFVAPEQVEPGFAIWNTYWWRRLKAGSAPAEPGPFPQKITLQPVRTFAELDYERFEAQYQLWRLLHPELAKWVSPADREEFEQSLEHQLVYTGHLPDGEKVGLIAGLPENYYGHEGVSVLELFVFPTYQGKGYGKALQGAFQEVLAPRFATFWGTIHSDNVASQATARSCGRQCVEWEYFFPLMPAHDSATSPPIASPV